MKINNRYKQAMEQAKESPAFWTESALLDVARRFLARMKEQGINQANLAEKMGKKSPYVSRLLSGKHNVTVETLSTAALALGMKIEINLEPIQKAKKSESLTVPMQEQLPAGRGRLRLVKTESHGEGRALGTLTSGLDGQPKKAA